MPLGQGYQRYVFVASRRARRFSLSVCWGRGWGILAPWVRGVALDEMNRSLVDMINSRLNVGVPINRLHDVEFCTGTIDSFTNF